MQQLFLISYSAIFLTACTAVMFAGREHAQEVVNIKHKDLHRLDRWYRRAIPRRVSVLRSVRNAAYLASFLRLRSRARGSSSLPRAYAARSRFIFITVIALLGLLRARCSAPTATSGIKSSRTFGSFFHNSARTAREHIYE